MYEECYWRRMLLGTLGASLLGNTSKGKGIARVGCSNKEKGIARAGYGSNMDF